MSEEALGEGRPREVLVMCACSIPMRFARLCAISGGGLGWAREVVDHARSHMCTVELMIWFFFGFSDVGTQYLI